MGRAASCCLWKRRVGAAEAAPTSNYASGNSKVKIEPPPGRGSYRASINDPPR
jgi:hypothetical protein